MYDEVKSPIQVVKIGMTRDMIIPEDIIPQPEIPRIEIPKFYANKRIIRLSTILQELANTYRNQNPIWSYYSRNHVLIYSNSKELRETNMETIRQWILMLLKPETEPIARAIREKFISEELLTRYCKTIGHKYSDHKCSKCNGGDNDIPEVQLE